MMNNIILNGVNSNTINGLLIQELPPISKPAIRTEIEEIDGRDGDILTKLGYAAYDKEISIGLYGDFDINEVISFFNTSGVVTFSNEPDKYYNYQIIDQIDFERLIRFRTATVTMHVQPFKYSATETELELDGTIITAEGTNLTLTNTENSAAFSEIELKGDTLQNGIPTPDTLIPVQVVKGNINVNICGKNLFDKNNVNIINGNMPSQNGVITSHATDKTLYIPCKPNTTYTFTKLVNTPYSRNQIAECSELPAIGVAYTNRDSQYSADEVANYTTSSNAKYIIWTFYNSDSTNYTLQEILDSIQIEVGNDATQYQAYQGQTYPINLGNIELCEIEGTYDYIYQNNGTWYLHKAINKVVLNGSETWNMNTTSIYKQFYMSMPYGARTGYSNYFVYNNSGDASTGNYYYFGGGNIVFVHPSYNNTNIETVANWKTWLSNNNVEVYYFPTTSTDTEITDSTLLSQLNALGNATTYLSTTNIVTSSDDLPPIIFVETLSIDEPILKVTNSGNANAKPVMTLYGNGTINLSLNGEQIFVINLTGDDYITIDIDNMEAYYNGVLKNRLVTGDYENFVLIPGENEITFTGTLYSIKISNYSRWV